MVGNWLLLQLADYNSVYLAFTIILLYNYFIILGIILQILICMLLKKLWAKIIGINQFDSFEVCYLLSVSTSSNHWFSIHVLLKRYPVEVFCVAIIALFLSKRYCKTTWFIRKLQPRNIQSCNWMYGVNLIIIVRVKLLYKF